MRFLGGETPEYFEVRRTKTVKCRMGLFRFGCVDRKSNARNKLSGLVEGNYQLMYAHAIYKQRKRFGLLSCGGSLCSTCAFLCLFVMYTESALVARNNINNQVCELGYGSRKG